MFAVLETVTLPPRRGWLRAGGIRVVARERPEYIGISIDLPFGTRERGVRKRIMRGLSQASRMGVAGVVLPKGFPFPDLPGMLGLAVSSPVPLLRRMAGSLCRFGVESASIQWENVRLSLTAARATPEMVSAAQMLSAYTKTFHIDAGEDTDALCYLLRSRCGVSAVGRPARINTVGRVQDIHILFDSPKQTVNVSGDAVVLYFGGGTPSISGGRIADGALLEPPRSLWKDWPGDCDNTSMLAALLASGQVALPDISIRGLTCGDSIFKL